MLHVSKRIIGIFILVIYAFRSSSLLVLTGLSFPMLSMDAMLMMDDYQRVLLSQPPPPRRINMTLRRGHLTQNLYVLDYKCGNPSLPNNTRHMHPSMKNTPGVFDFTTFLSTDLKILIMGDSIGIQVSQVLEELMGGKPENRKVYRYSWSKFEGIHVSAPIRGGGVIAGWRLLGMLLKKNLNARLPNFGPGWRMEDVYNVTHHTYNVSQSMSGDLVEMTRQLGSFDVLLFHIPIGWIKDYNSINNNTLMETVLLAGELFGVETVIFNVPSFTNNVITVKQLQSLREAQHRVVQFAKDYVPPNIKANNTNTTMTTSTVKHVLTLRMDQLMDKTMEWNARLIGMIPNVTTTKTSTGVVTTTTTTNSTATIAHDEEENDWRLVSLPNDNHNKNYGKKFVNHVAQSCSALPSPETPNTCTPNHFSVDGMHICMETIGSHLLAGFGCVVGCVYNNNNHDYHDNNNNHDLYSSSLPATTAQCHKEQCAATASSNKLTTSSPSTKLVDYEKEKEIVLHCTNACNDRYLSLTSVDNELVG